MLPGVAVCVLVFACVARGQPDPSGTAPDAARPLAAAVDATVTFGSRDPGYFNYASDAYDLSRLLRADASAAWRVSDRVSLLGEVRAQADLGEHESLVRVQSAFVRLRPWPARRVDVQAGLVPPVFGSFSRRVYARGDPLIGLPLGYQYLTSLRPDAIPARASELLGSRARGWLVQYQVGSRTADNGVPLVDAVRNQLGVEARVETSRFELSGSVTQGSPADPDLQVRDLRAQYAGRLAWTPGPGVALGVSFARGRFLRDHVLDAAAAHGSADVPPAGSQVVIGGDAEYSRGYWLVRAEVVSSRWVLPAVSSPFIDRPLRAAAVAAEARYRFGPGGTAALRVDRLHFSDIVADGVTRSWDAPVTRVEAGVAYALSRALTARAGYQYNWRDSAYFSHEGLALAGLLFWF